MGFPYIFQTIDEPMSAYTAMVFWAIFMAIPIVGCVMYSLWKREISRIDKEMAIHDEFIINTSEIIGKMRTDTAVTRERVEGTQSDVGEIKESLAGINKTLWEQFVK